MKIFSSNEWDPLKEVVVGNVFDTYSINTDLSFQLFFKDNLEHNLWGWLQDTSNKIIIKEQYIHELNEDIDAFIDVLVNEGINVHRPTQLDTVPRYTVGGVEVDGMPALNVRDQVIIIDDTIVETAPAQRSRYYENELLQPIFNNAQGKHVKMPKSEMLDEHFDHELINYKGKLSYDNKTNYNVTEFFKDGEFIVEVPNNIQMMIDGANCVRFNDDILINIANRNQYLGYQWFKEHFPNKNWHPIYSLCDNHLDSFIIPLTEGVLLLRNELFLEQIPNFLKDWKIIYPPKTTPHFPDYNKDDTMLTSTFIDMNVLAIGNDKIICNSLYPELCDLLYNNGFYPIPVQHRHRRIFAGGFHCFTLDLHRSTT